MACLAVILYSPSLDHGFIGDDFSYLYLYGSMGDGLEYASGFPASNLFGYYRPLNDGMFALVEWLGGGPYSHHFLNIMLHAMNSALAYLLFQRFLKPFMALMGVLLYTTLPTNVQSVVWVSDRADLLMAFFFLLSLLSFDRYLTGNRQSVTWLVLSVFLYLGAVGSKETAITLFLIPGILAMYHSLAERHPKLPIQNTARIIAVFFSVSLLYIVIRLLFVQRPPQVAPNMNVDMVPAHFLLSLFAFFFRSIPAHVFGASVPVLFGMIALGVFLVFILTGIQSERRERKDLARSAAYILLTYLAAILAIVLVAGWPGPDLQRSRYFYLPGLVFAFAFASTAEFFVGSRNDKRLKAVIGVVIPITVIFVLSTRGHLRAYEEGAEFFDIIATRFIESFPEPPAYRIGLFVPQDYKGVPMIPYGFADALRLRGAYDGVELDIQTYPPEASRNSAFLARLRSDDRLLFRYSVNRGDFIRLSGRK